MGLEEPFKLAARQSHQRRNLFGPKHVFEVAFHQREGGHECWMADVDPFGHRQPLSQSVT